MVFFPCEDIRYLALYRLKKVKASCEDFRQLEKRKVLSEEKASTSDSEDEEYAMAVRDFKKFFRRRGKFVRQPHDDKKNFQKIKEDKKEKEDRRFGIKSSKLEPDEWIKDSGCSRHIRAKIQVQKGCPIISIRTDHGREFDNEVQFGAFCDANGFTHNFLAPRTPQSNGVVERKKLYFTRNE
ncbi:retrovirus-related pol polyprotein from transposon TNT 1-94 [Tanacetum coccineum]